MLADVPHAAREQEAAERKAQAAIELYAADAGADEAEEASERKKKKKDKRKQKDKEKD